MTKIEKIKVKKDDKILHMRVGMGQEEWDELSDDDKSNILYDIELLNRGIFPDEQYGSGEFDPFGNEVAQ